MSHQEQSLLSQINSCSAVGSFEIIKERMAQFIEQTGANELMLVCAIFEHDKRIQALELAAEAGRQIVSQGK